MSDSANQPPPVRHDFQQVNAERAAEANKQKDLKQTETVTQKQLEAMQARQAPRPPQPQLTPGGELQQASHSQEEVAFQKKLAEVKRKLNTARQDMRQNFGRAR